MRRQEVVQHVFGARLAGARLEVAAVLYWLDPPHLVYAKGRRRLDGDYYRDAHRHAEKLVSV